MGARTYRVGRDDRLREAIAARVEVKTPLALRDSSFRRQLVWMCFSETPANLAREFQDLIDVGSQPQWNKDVHPLAAGRLRVRNEADAIERIANHKARADGVGEFSRLG